MARMRDDLSHSAIQIDGSFLEDIIPGFLTTHVSGREFVERDLVDYDETRADGSTLNYSRYPAREIEVEYVLGETMDVYHPAFVKLMSYLNRKDAKIIFNDEPNRYFIGTPVMTKVDKKTIFAKGTYVIKCYDPFKYDVNETEVIGVQEVVDGVDVIKLEGDFGPYTYGTYPRFEVEFASDTQPDGSMGKKGECGYLLFTKKDTDYSLQFGDDKEQDTMPANVATDFRKATMGDVWKDSDAVPPSPWLRAGSCAITSTGAGGDTYGTYPSAYHGPTLETTLPAPVDGEFTMTWQQVFACTANKTPGVKQMGSFGVMFMSGPKIEFGLFYNKAYSVNFNVQVYTDDRLNGLMKRGLGDCSYTGPTGYTGTTSDSKARERTNIIKRYKGDDGKWYYSVDATLYKNDALCGYSEALPIDRVVFYFSQYDNRPLLTVNKVRQMSFRVEM